MAHSGRVADQGPALVRRADARRRAGSVGDAPGVKVAVHVPGPAIDPRDGPFDEIDPMLEEQAAGYVRSRLPGLEAAGIAAETCLYTMTSDEDFVLDREGPLVIGCG